MWGPSPADYCTFLEEGVLSFVQTAKHLHPVRTSCSSTLGSSDRGARLGPVTHPDGRCAGGLLVEPEHPPLQEGQPHAVFLGQRGDCCGRKRGQGGLPRGQGAGQDGGGQGVGQGLGGAAEDEEEARRRC